MRKVECRVNQMTGHGHRCKMPVEVRQSMMILSLSVSEWQQLAEMVVLALYFLSFALHSSDVYLVETSFHPWLNGRSKKTI